MTAQLAFHSDFAALTEDVAEMVNDVSIIKEVKMNCLEGCEDRLEKLSVSI